MKLDQSVINQHVALIKHLIELEKTAEKIKVKPDQIKNGSVVTQTVSKIKVAGEEHKLTHVSIMKQK